MIDGRACVGAFAHNADAWIHALASLGSRDRGIAIQSKQQPGPLGGDPTRSEGPVAGELSLDLECELFGVRSMEEDAR